MAPTKQEPTPLPPLSHAEALVLVEALREALYDAVAQLADARIRLRTILKMTEK
jgi:hypothetical protein